MSEYQTRPLTSSELAEWRAGKDVVSAAAPPRDPGTRITRGPERKPLSPRETYEAMYEDTLASIRSDRESYRRAVAWLKATTPGMADLTDAQVEKILDEKVRESVTRVTRAAWKPVIVGG